MIEPKPRVSDGEPFCSGTDCPYFHFTEWAGGKVLSGKCSHASLLGYAMAGTLCIPGLRAQRDEALAQRDEARKELCVRAFGSQAEIVAHARGWLYLYDEKREDPK